MMHKYTLSSSCWLVLKNAKDTNPESLWVTELGPDLRSVWRFIPPPLCHADDGDDDVDGDDADDDHHLSPYSSSGCCWEPL